MSFSRRLAIRYCARGVKLGHGIGQRRLGAVKGSARRKTPVVKLALKVEIDARLAFLAPGRDHVGLGCAQPVLFVGLIKPRDKLPGLDPVANTDQTLLQPPADAKPEIGLHLAFDCPRKRHRVAEALFDDGKRARGTRLDLGLGLFVLGQAGGHRHDRRLNPAEVLVVNSPDLVRRQAVPMGTGAKTVLAALAIMVFLLATGLVPPSVAGLIAAGIILISGVLSVEGVYRAINWTTVILVGALTPLSIAMQQTGAANLMAEKLVATVGDSGPYALLAGLFVFSAVMSQVVSNTATSLIVIPISVVTAHQMGISVQPVLMCVGIACAAAFITPVATPTNLMVMEPGAYKFGDYWKLGLPIMIWFFVVSVFLVPLIWPF